MNEETKAKVQEEAGDGSPPADSRERPDLPESFYAELLGLPACKRGLPCDGCMRCEH